MRFVRALMATVAVSTATSVAAQSLPPPAPPALPVVAKPRAYTDAEKNLAVEIATLLNSSEDTERAIDSSFGANLVATLSTQPVYATLEKQYPGIIQVIGAALGQELKTVSSEQLPRLWNDLGVVYAETFDGEQLAKLLAFYRSPVGAHLIGGLYRNVDTQALVKRGMESPETPVSAADLRAFTSPAARKAAAQLSEADQLAVAKFMMSPIGLKLMGIGPRLRSVAADWTNRLQTQQNSTRLEAAVFKAGGDFIAAADARAAKKGN